MNLFSYMTGTQLEMVVVQESNQMEWVVACVPVLEAKVRGSSLEQPGLSSTHRMCLSFCRPVAAPEASFYTWS